MIQYIMAADAAPSPGLLLGIFGAWIGMLLLIALSIVGITFVYRAVQKSKKKQKPDSQQ